MYKLHFDNFLINEHDDDVPIRKFRIGRTCRAPSYHKLRSLTVQQRHQHLRRLQLRFMYTTPLYV